MKRILLGVGRIYHYFGQFRFGEVQKEVKMGVVGVLGVGVDAKMLAKEYF